ncbi:tryptophan synthase beta subunit-like PLP-dependent enzyme [Aspergillus desertorum]
MSPLSLHAGLRLNPADYRRIEAKTEADRFEKDGRQTNNPTSPPPRGLLPLHNRQHPDKGTHAVLYLELECASPTGSCKDLMALSMIEEAEARGDLRPGMTVVKPTGGRSGVFTCVHLRIEGDEACRWGGSGIVHAPDGKITKIFLPGMMQRAKERVESHRHAFHNQGRSPRRSDAVCGAAGSGGMLMGVCKVLRAERPDTKVVVLEPASSPAISEGRAGVHGAKGIAPGFVPPHLDRAEARTMCRRLAREEGVLVGTSTGMNAVAAARLARELGPGKTVVTVACDPGLQYMDGDLLADS